MEYSATEANLAASLVEAVNSVEGLHTARTNLESRQIFNNRRQYLAMIAAVAEKQEPRQEEGWPGQEDSKHGGKLGQGRIRQQPGKNTAGCSS